MTDTETASLTEKQRNEIRGIVFGMVREYWTEDGIKDIARTGY